MDFDFRKFSARSFERFSQAMALHVLGKGVLVFGDGPDGAREATYEGKLNYPSDKENWSGYTILQAKFLQVPGSPKEDADWLVKQLTDELEKFVQPGSKLVRPDYYILVSNAKLSPMPAGKRGKGGIAKIDAIFAKYKNKIKIKDYRVWHHDQLATMLMGASELRRSYAAWLSSSDVIADLLDDIQNKSTEVREAMYRYLSRELRSHQPIRLQQAGHAGDAQTMIEDVFTDLPYRIADQREIRGHANILLLASLLERSRDCLDGASVKIQPQRGNGRPERILLLGGPGQGKSTLSQFLAQIFRANILYSERHGRYSAEISRIIDSTLTKAASGGLSIEVPRRFPFRVDLPNFADWLSTKANADNASVLHYLAEQISGIADAKVKIEDLRRWISEYPIILILDGLDEVPASANRGSVLRAINEFWDEATNSDLLMIVATRPQGYNDELDPSYYTKLEMIPLSPVQALAYAEKLAGARIVDSIQLDRVIARIKEAASSKTTARLMVSPLQVAILLALIDQRGDAPTDRWSLFDKYFSVVLQREQGKAGSVGETMRHWGRQISAIHYKTGFLLHVEAETQGNSEAHLSTHDLKDLIRGQLIDEEFEGEELERVTAELLGASTERLVLLVQREEDRFSFEVRSLQEFMAAAYLMTGREATVQKRLRTIANREHWLHVFQIAASKCFSINDAEQYRDTVVTLCNDINENGEEIDRLLRTGSKLALALLDDGLAYDQPKYRRLLLSTAFDLLLSGPTLLPESLSDHCGRDSERTVEQLRRYLSSTLSDPVQAAWKLILRCASAEQSWTKDLLDEIWPQNPEKIAEILSYGIEFSSDSSLHRRLRQALELVSPVLLKDVIVREAGDKSFELIESLSNSFPCLEVLTYSSKLRRSINLKINNVETPVSWHISPLSVGELVLKIYDDFPNTTPWESLRAIRAFHNDPNAIKLADLLDQIAVRGWQKDAAVMQVCMPWPLESLFSLTQEGGDLHETARDVRAGLYGDYGDWRAAEERWFTNGFVERDYEKCNSGSFFDADVANVGVSWSMVSVSPTIPQKDTQWLTKLIKYALDAQGVPRNNLVQMLRFILGFYSPEKSLPVNAVLVLLEGRPNSSESPHISTNFLVNLPFDFLENELLLKRLNQIGQDGNIRWGDSSKVSPKLYQLLIDKLNDYPGLVVFLAKIYAADKSDVSVDIFRKIDFSPLLKNDSKAIKGSAQVLALIVNVIDELEIDDIFRDHVDNGKFQPLYLLRQFFESDKMGREKKRDLAEAVSAVINKMPALPYRRFMSQIQTCANGRLSDLHRTDCWRGLDLGETLLLLASRRQNQMIS